MGERGTGDSGGPVLEIRSLSVRFRTRGESVRRSVQDVHAVDGVDLEVKRGETLGLVGESGSGKTTLGRAVLQLLPAEADVQGSVVFDGMPLVGMRRRALRRTRRRLQMIFQDPYGSLNPRMRVLDLLGDPLEIHGIASGKKKIERVEALLELVGLDRSAKWKFPHAFSGGQRQRIAIARALAVNPDLVVCDEPVTALDVSVQAQILNLLCELQASLGLSYLFIAHDLSMVRHMSDRVAVMYLGKIMEIGDADVLYDTPSHPYTHALVSAIPVPDPDVERSRRRVVLTGGDIPSPRSIPSGCRFRTRCWLYEQLGEPETCAIDEPELRVTETGAQSACHYADEISAGMNPVTSAAPGPGGA